MNKKAFTVVEIVFVCLIVVMLFGMIQKIFSGTFSNFFKSQTKLTNLRSASLLLEHLKYDLRLAAVPPDNSPPCTIASTADTLNFKFKIREENLTKEVVYDFAKGIVTRTEDGKATRTISQAKVSRFDISQAETGKSKFIKIEIEVDAEKDEIKRSASSKSNHVVLRAMLFPKFFKNFADEKEEYWNKARQISGG